MEWLYGKVSDYTLKEFENIYTELSPSRKERIDRFSKREDALRSLVGELLAKKLLKEKYGIENIALQAAPNGKPFLLNDDLFVSISHCDDRVVCAVDINPVGIDIECIKPVKLGLMQRVCVEQELEYVFGNNTFFEENILCENTEILTRFFEIWTAKEAYFKKCGTGITNFKSVNILPLKRQIFHIDNYLVQIVSE